MEQVKNEILDWLRLKRKSSVEGAMYVGSEDEIQSMKEEDEFAKGYNRALDDIKEIIESIFKRVK